jgi:ABC-type Zn uptake system ZnuABC Zn-binding protein ZnuA
LLIFACSGSDAGTVAHKPEQHPALSVVVTSNIVADWVRRVGGERVEVFSLSPVGGDPHTFQPGARDAARIADADLVVSIGLDLEAAWLAELVRNAAVDESRLAVLGEAVSPIPFAGGGEGARNGDGTMDPHFWLDPLRVELAVSAIAARLSGTDPAAGNVYTDNAQAYSRQLRELHAWIQERVSSLPQDRRLLATSHDSFQYFALLYGFEIVGTVIPGATTEREPSAAELARLVDKVKESGAPAIFVETTVSDRLARTIAEETGARVVNALYTGSLGGPGGADTYVEMMRANVTRIVEALE